MKFPWVKRAEELHKETVKAEEELVAVKKRWTQIRSLSELSRVRINGNEVTPFH